jgi:hypothetical protein
MQFSRCVARLEQPSLLLQPLQHGRVVRPLRAQLGFELSLKTIAAIEDPPVIDKILGHLGLPDKKSPF